MTDREPSEMERAIAACALTDAEKKKLKKCRFFGWRHYKSRDGRL